MHEEGMRVRLGRRGPAADPTGERRRIAEYLAARGPTYGDRIAEDLGLTADRFWRLVNCPWFRIVTGGWGLSPQGRREAVATA